ncbi:MAG TPA: TspO/MBR family protein [Devosiaceae bacterium]|nr:TspO/MBR family protein [Devosiaceae bacterium]
MATFLVVVVGIGGLIGFLTAPGQWYAGLEKPPFNPPAWLFGPVWLILYIFIAVAGWRTFERDSHGTSMRLWYGQMALNWLWPPVFFSLHLPWLAAAVILALLATIIAFIVSVRDHDRLAAVLFLPYAAWVAFASLLNLSIAILN